MGNRLGCQSDSSPMPYFCLVLRMLQLHICHHLLYFFVSFEGEVTCRLYDFVFIYHGNINRMLITHSFVFLFVPCFVSLFFHCTDEDDDSKAPTQPLLGKGRIFRVFYFEAFFQFLCGFLIFDHVCLSLSFFLFLSFSSFFLSHLPLCFISTPGPGSNSSLPVHNRLIANPTTLCLCHLTLNMTCSRECASGSLCFTSPFSLCLVFPAFEPVSSPRKLVSPS